MIMNTLKDYIQELNEREFLAVWHEDGVIVQEKFNLNTEIKDDDYEWKYSLAECADNIDLLRRGETTEFFGSRDEHGRTRGFIVRIK